MKSIRKKNSHNKITYIGGIIAKSMSQSYVPVCTISTSAVFRASWPKNSTFTPFITTLVTLTTTSVIKMEIFY